MMKKSIIVILLLAFASGNHAASFDCAKAATQVEKSICAESRISDLDNLLMLSYKKALANAADSKSLKSEQRAWLTKVRNKCQDSICLKRVYNERLSALNSIKAVEKIAKVSCDDVIYGKENYFENMGKLCEVAGFEGFNKHHEVVKSILCEGRDFKDIDRKVDIGEIEAAEAEAMAQVLGKKYKAPARTAEGTLYEKVYVGLGNLGMCNACASNAADEYVENPKSAVGKLVKAALAGDDNALNQLNQ